MDIFWILDPDPHNNRCGSATLVTHSLSTRMSMFLVKRLLGCNDSNLELIAMLTMLMVFSEHDDLVKLHIVTMMTILT